MDAIRPDFSGARRAIEPLAQLGAQLDFEPLRHAAWQFSEAAKQTGIKPSR